jgi:biotin carboxylase
MRVLIIAPNGSYRSAPFMQAATRLQAEVMIASEGPLAASDTNRPGLSLPLDNPTAALEKIVDAATITPFSAILGTDDSTTELAALAAARLGLVHNPVDAVRLARRKDLARARLAVASVPVPSHRTIRLDQPLPPQIDTVQYPCVLKPVSLSASRGVMRADNPTQLHDAVNRLRKILQTAGGGEEAQIALIESFVPGVEVAVEGLLVEGRLSVLAIFDKPDPLDGPFFEETYYITPTRHAAATQQALHDVIEDACAAYGLIDGPIHAECRINDEGVWIIEVAARTIGGLCGRLLTFGAGIGLEELVLAHALRRPFAPEAGQGAAGVLMIPIRQGGILRRVEGVLAAERVPFIEEVVIDVREGYELVPLPEGSSYLGFLFARAPDPAQAEAALRTAHACLNVVVLPLWKAAAP